MILGIGEVGNSLLSLYKTIQPLNGVYNIYYKDTNKKTDMAVNIQSLKDYIDVEVLHVCIPYIKDFNEVVISNIKTYKPNIVFIHSTVDVGTTRHIAEQTDCIVCHTPVMGVHPNLTKSIQTFKKIVGVIKPEDKEPLLRHLDSIKVSVEFYDTPEESEAAKLFSTSYYGTVIRFMQDTYNFCKDNNLDFEKVYTRTNQIYNEGYSKMGMNHVIRPVLKYMGEGIFGHCVKPNAKILSKKLKTSWIESILGDEE